MNMNLLRYVMAVYEEKSMTKAARKLYVAQPSLSQSIRLLEEDLGTKLFDRSQTPLKVTAAGEIFVHWAKHTLSSEQKMRKYLLDISTEKIRKLIIGSSPQMCKETFPDALQKFYAVTKGCSVVLKECRADEAKLLLERDSIDFLIDRPNSDYDCVPIVEEGILLAAPASFQFSVNQAGAYPSISISDLTDMPFIYLSDNEWFANTVNDMFKIIKSTPNIVLECSSLQEAHNMVSHNIGVTLVPKYCIKQNTPTNVCYYIFREYPISHTMAVLHRKDRPLTKDAMRFISILKDIFTENAKPDIE